MSGKVSSITSLFLALMHIAFAISKLNLVYFIVFAELFIVDTYDVYLHEQTIYAVRVVVRFLK